MICAAVFHYVWFTWRSLWASVLNEVRAMAAGNLGRSAVSLNRLEEAEAALTCTLQLHSNVYTSSVELALLRSQRGDWPGVRQAFRQYLTVTEFCSLPQTLGVLPSGISIESRFNNQKLTGDFTRIHKKLHHDYTEYA